MLPNIILSVILDTADTGYSTGNFFSKPTTSTTSCSTRITMKTAQLSNTCVSYNTTGHCYKLQTFNNAFSTQCPWDFMQTISYVLPVIQINILPPC